MSEALVSMVLIMNISTIPISQVARKRGRLGDVQTAQGIQNKTTCCRNNTKSHGHHTHKFHNSSQSKHGNNLPRNGALLKKGALLQFSPEDTRKGHFAHSSAIPPPTALKSLRSYPLLRHGRGGGRS